jgi:hypothetical protein
MRHPHRQIPLDQRATRASSPVPSRRCGPATCGPSGPSCSWSAALATWHCSTSPSTASCAAVIWWRCASMDVAPNGYAVDRATVRQSKTGRPVRFELTEVTRLSLDDSLRATGRRPGQCLFRGVVRTAVVEQQALDEALALRARCRASSERPSVTAKKKRRAVAAWLIDEARPQSRSSEPGSDAQYGDRLSQCVVADDHAWPQCR